MGNGASGIPLAPPLPAGNVCQCQQEPPQPTRKLVVLMVPFHCPTCAVKVKRKLHDIEGVETVDLDAESNRVTVTGTMDTASLVLDIFRRFRKQAQVLHEREERVRWRMRGERNTYYGAFDGRRLEDGACHCCMAHRGGFYDDDYDARGHEGRGCDCHHFHPPGPLYYDEPPQNCSIM